MSEKRPLWTFSGVQGAGDSRSETALPDVGKSRSAAGQFRSGAATESGAGTEPGLGAGSGAGSRTGKSSSAFFLRAKSQIT